MKDRSRVRRNELLGERDELFDTWGLTRKSRGEDFDALTELPADAGDIKPSQLRKLMRVFAPISKATGKLGMLNALIDAKAISKHNTINDAINQLEYIEGKQREVEGERGGEGGEGGEEEEKE
jgi:hypothetical protein